MRFSRPALAFAILLLLLPAVGTAEPAARPVGGDETVCRAAEAKSVDGGGAVPACPPSDLLRAALGGEGLRTGPRDLRAPLVAPSVGDLPTRPPASTGDRPGVSEEFFRAVPHYLTHRSLLL